MIKGKKYLIGIDLLRGLAAFAVYYYHQHIGSLLAEYTGIETLGYTDVIGAEYAVPLFFLTSGFCIHLANMKSVDSRTPLNLKRYYLNRFWRIYPTYFIVLLLSVGINNITGWQEKATLPDFLFHFFTLQGYSVTYFNSINLVLWTITVEIAFYLVYPVYYYIQLKYSSNSALLFSAIISCCSILLFYITSPDMNPPKYYLFTNLWFGWCLGAWICNQVMEQPSYFKSARWYIISFILLLVFVFVFLFNWTNDLLIKNIVYTIIWAPLLVWLLSKEGFLESHKKLLKIPLMIGLSSYSLYLLHEPLINLKNYLIHLTGNSQLRLILMIISIFLIPAIAYLSYLLFERPFMIYRKSMLNESR